MVANGAISTGTNGKWCSTYHCCRVIAIHSETFIQVLVYSDNHNIFSTIDKDLSDKPQNLSENRGNIEHLKRELNAIYR